MSSIEIGGDSSSVETAPLMAAMHSELQRVWQGGVYIAVHCLGVGEAPGGLQGGLGSDRVVGRGRGAAKPGGWPTPSSRPGVLSGGGAGGGGLSRGLFQTPGSTYSSRG
jgi:hypothetical protein